jgi:hypothetical protein
VIAGLAFLAFCVICAVAEPNKPLTPQRETEIEALKMNCVTLSYTPMSAMTPRDLEDWDFCERIPPVNQDDASS